MQNNNVLGVLSVIFLQKIAKFLYLTGLVFFSIHAVSSQDKHSQQNLHAGIPYSISDIENINLTNGNLMFNFGFGVVKGRGSAMKSLSLKYNSKLYESHVDTDLDVSGNLSPQKFLRADQEGGWQYDGDYELRVINRNDDLDQPIQVSDSCGVPNYKSVFVWKLLMYFPDGSQHEFRPTGFSDTHQSLYGLPQTGDGFFNVATNGQVSDLNFSCIVPSPGCQDSCSTNYFSYQHPSSKMVYYSTDGTYMRLEIPSGQSIGNPANWTVYMPDGSRVENSATSFQKIYDKNGNYITGLTDEVGRSISKVTYSPMEDHILRLGVNGESVIWKVRWKYITAIKAYRTSGTSDTTMCCYSDQVLLSESRVVDEIEMPWQMGGQKYIFQYNGHAGQVNWNGSIPNPNSSPGWGELIGLTLPAGAKAEYDYQSILDTRTDNLLPQLGKIKEKRLKYDVSYDGTTPQQVTDTWLYSILQSGTGTVTGPDGGVTTQNFYSTSTDSDLSGRVFKETSPSGTIVERIWANNKVGGCPSYGCGSMRRLNTYVKTEFTSIPDAFGILSLTAVKDFEYDKNGNITKISEYDWIPYVSMPKNAGGSITGIPAGATPTRVTENAYYSQTENASNATANNSNSYWNATAPNVRNAISSTTEKNGGGTPVSRSEFDYFDVNTTANMIQARSWDSQKGGTYQAYSSPLTTTNSITTTTAYDSFGNPTFMLDAKQNETRITYGPVNGYSGLYPTQTVVADGESEARTSAATYDFYTGVTTSATDVDNNISVITEYDALGRPKKVRNGANTALESWTTTDYNDVARRVIVRSDLINLNDQKIVSIQHYDQLGRVRLSRTLENSATESATDETQGIKVQTRYLNASPNSYQVTSNPYRSAYSFGETATTMGWTRSKSWSHGRKQEVETFTGNSLPAPWGGNGNSTGKVVTDIDADRTLVTDQAGKQRISRTNALGQLMDVWEVRDSDPGQTTSISFPNYPAITQGYQTSYEYDTLNNLKKVTQGNISHQAARNFTYSSLSRLTSASNPESGLLSYVYDNNGNLTRKLDARGVYTHFSYDPLNRVTRKWYNNSSTSQTNGPLPSGVGATDQVVYTYDQGLYGKGYLSTTQKGGYRTDFYDPDDEFDPTTSRDALGRPKFQRRYMAGYFGTHYYTVNYDYNLAGGVEKVTYPSGRYVEYDYDSAGRTSEARGTLGDGNLRTYATGIQYSPFGGMTRQRFGTDTNLYHMQSFNSRGQLENVRLSSVDGSSCDDANCRGKIVNNYGTTANNGNLLSQKHFVPGGTIYRTSFGYDELNRLKWAKENYGTGDVSDAAWETRTQSWKQTNIYDRWGNRTIDQNTSNTTTNVNRLLYGVDTTKNRLTVPGGGSGVIEYDLAGNLTKDTHGGVGIGTQETEYNAENLVTRHCPPFGCSDPTIFRYDGDGKRTEIYGNGYASAFVYGVDGAMLYETTGEKEHAYVNGQMLVTTSRNLVWNGSSYVYESDFRWLVTDHLGTPRMTIKKSGAAADLTRHDYLPFGEEISPTIGPRNTTGQGYSYPQSDGVRQQFTGYERDQETGLDFAQARYFGSAMGRFTSVDPLMASAQPGSPQTFNRYTYAWNRPLILTDPTGLCPTGVPGTGCAEDVIRVFTIWVRTLNNYLDYNGGYSGGNELPDGTRYRERYTSRGTIPEFLKPGSPVGDGIQAGNKAMNDLNENAIQKVPLLSNLVNAQMAGVNDDYGGFATEMGMFGVDLGTSVFTGGTARAARGALSANLLESGISRPLNSAAHHIVAFADRRAGAARAILEKAGVDINDAVNGVFLPATTRVAGPGGTAHSTIHTNAYYEALTNRLRDSRNVRDELILIRKEILNGTFPN